MMRPLCRALYVLILLAGLAGCGGNEGNPVDPNTPDGRTVTTTIVGLLVTEGNQPIAGATVAAYGKSAVTGDHGLFYFKDIQVPEERCIVSSAMPGYYTATRAEIPKANGFTHMHLTLIASEPKFSVNAAAGGTISLPGGGTLQLPGGQLVLENGAVYSGTARVAIIHRDTGSATFYSAMPGDCTAERNDGTSAQLLSQSVVRISMNTSSGVRLRLAPGAKAILKYPLAGDMPAEVPVWLFDEDDALWKEAGRAIKEGELYTAELSDVGILNYAVPMETAYIGGKVHTNEGEPLPHVVIRFNNCETMSDGDGYFKCRVPAGMPLTASVDCGANLLGSSETIYINVGMIASGQTLAKDISLDVCPSYFVGSLVGCSSEPVPGIVQMWTQSNYINHATYGITKDGWFKVRFPYNNGIVEATEFSTGKAKRILAPPAWACKTGNLGPIGFCPQNEIPSFVISTNTDFVDVIELSADAQLLAVAAKDSVRLYNAKNGVLLRSLPVAASKCDFSNDGTKLLTMVRGNGQSTTARVWDVATGEELFSLDYVTSAVLMPDGMSLLAVVRASLSSYETRQYNIASGAMMQQLDVSANPCYVAGTYDNGREFIHIALVPFAQPYVIRITISTGERNGLVFLPNEYYSWASNSISFSADKGWLAIRSDVNRRHFIDIIRDRIISFEPNISAALSPDGEYYVQQMSTPTLYQRSTLHLIGYLPSDWVSHTAFEFSMDGSHLAGLFREGNIYKVRVWQLKK